MMPAIHSMRLAARPSRKLLMIGMPPATAASYDTATPFSAAAVKISLPCNARSALLAVTTCLPAAMASSTRLLAGSMPPITSTTMSISGSLTRSCQSLESVTRSSTMPRARSILRQTTVLTSMGAPARRESSCALRLRTAYVPPPTVPSPAMPILTASIVSFLLFCNCSGAFVWPKTKMNALSVIVLICCAAHLGAIA